MNTPMVRERVRSAIHQKRVVIIRHIREEEVIAAETRMIPLDIVNEIRGIAKQQAYLIGFKVDLGQTVPIEEKDFVHLMIETISEVRITHKEFDPTVCVNLYRKMKRTPTVAWMIKRDW